MGLPSAQSSLPASLLFFNDRDLSADLLHGRTVTVGLRTETQHSTCEKAFARSFPHRILPLTSRVGNSADCFLEEELAIVASNALESLVELFLLPQLRQLR